MIQAKVTRERHGRVVAAQECRGRCVVVLLISSTVASKARSVTTGASWRRLCLARVVGCSRRWHDVQGKKEREETKGRESPKGRMRCVRNVFDDQMLLLFFVEEEEERREKPDLACLWLPL